MWMVVTGDANANIDAGDAPSNMRPAFSLSLREKFKGLGCPEHHDAPFPEMKLARMHLMRAGPGTPSNHRLKMKKWTPQDPGLAYPDGLQRPPE